LLGYSFSGQKNPHAAGIDLDALIPKAVELLRGESVPPGLEPDEVRDRLLAGFQYILVDEYQDIDEPQYELISAIAGRTLDDADLKLSILAVGDDDQNIYTFRGANVEFIRRFQRDYGAEVHYLIENYRSTRCIIEAANQLIAANTDRMKSEHPIRLDARRGLQPAGGDFGQRDALTGGKVQVIRVADESEQARAVIAELRRLRALGVNDWSQIAVLSRSHRELAQVRALAEQESIPIRWLADRNKMPPLHQVREIRNFLRRLSELRNSLARATDLIRTAVAFEQRSPLSPSLSPSEGERVPEGRVRGQSITSNDVEILREQPPNPWTQLLHRLLEAWRSESDDAELPMREALEFLYESCAESRRDLSYGEGVTLSTVHAAKGAEHDHVLLIGAWPLHGKRAEQEDLRRTFYVGMTRARQTLAVFDQSQCRPSLPGTLEGAPIVQRKAGLPPGSEPLPPLNYTVLGLEEIHLSYAGYFHQNHAIHATLAGLEPGDRLALRPEQDRIGLFSASGVCIARLARKAAAQWQHRLGAIRDVRVLALVQRTVDQETEPDRAARCRVSEWEIPIIELVFDETGKAS
jgi:ATP-dependent DNA helicase RecQ